ncbi:SRPBCC family protein [Nocardioides piscis]|uniref:SRPBCC family protein n=1 Tax=Nocardioides piscis TaxID=2714938 RepID=A0A6G7YBZ5_9ACTN|nr:hypothetical protein [Nocardioides piscis]QIK74342.1 hypothetical protein G7071_01685 [Nocardioides piscis]
MRISAAGPATTQQVWERFTRTDLWPTWAPQLRRVTCPDSVITAGSRGTAHGPALLRIPFEVLVVDRDELRWVWRVGRPLGVTMEHGVDKVPEGARAWVDLPIALAPYAPLAHLALRRLVRR